MKVTIIDKSEGYVTARFDAESPIEAVMLSTAPLTTAETSIELKTDTSTDWSKSPPATKNVAYLTFHAFRIECHSVMQGGVREAK